MARGDLHDLRDLGGAARAQHRACLAGVSACASRSGSRPCRTRYRRRSTAPSTAMQSATKASACVGSAGRSARGSRSAGAGRDGVGGFNSRSCRGMAPCAGRLAFGRLFGRRAPFRFALERREIRDRAGRNRSSRAPASLQASDATGAGSLMPRTTPSTKYARISIVDHCSVYRLRLSTPIERATAAARP